MRDIYIYVCVSVCMYVNIYKVKLKYRGKKIKVHIVTAIPTIPKMILNKCMIECTIDNRDLFNTSSDDLT